MLTSEWNKTSAAFTPLCGTSSCLKVSYADLPVWHHTAALSAVARDIKPIAEHRCRVNTELLTTRHRAAWSDQSTQGRCVNQSELTGPTWRRSSEDEGPLSDPDLACFHCHLKDDFLLAAVALEGTIFETKQQTNFGFSLFCTSAEGRQNSGSDIWVPFSVFDNGNAFNCVLSQTHRTAWWEKQSVSGRENTALSGVFCARRDCKNPLAVQKMNIWSLFKADMTSFNQLSVFNQHDVHIKLIVPLGILYKMFLKTPYPAQP